MTYRMEFAKHSLIAAIAVLGSSGVAAATTVVAGNSAPITINDFTAPTGGVASLYPSTTLVSGIASNRVSRVRVVLRGFSHTFPDDVDVFLVGPNGQRAMIMSDAGGDPNVTGLDITLAPATPVPPTAPPAPPPDAGPLVTTTYRAFNYAGNDGQIDVFPAPGPGNLVDQPAELDEFADTNPNGTWQLFVVDDQAQDVGNMANGWFLLLTVPDVRIVTKVADTNDGVCDADCSLREAIAVADPTDIIRFAPLFNSPRTIVLGGSELVIDKELSIEGPGAHRLTISGNHASRVLTVAAAAKAMIAGVTIANGSASAPPSGGGIHNSGELLVRDSEIAGNEAALSGGGIFNLGRLTITGTTLASNRSGEDGGAIANNGTQDLLLAGVTLTGNVAGRNGGALYQSAAGGFADIEDGTISRNSASGLTAGGIHRNSGTVQLRNTIVAGNFGNTTSPDIFLGGGTGYTTLGYNLIGNRGTATGVTIAVADQVGTSAAPIDARLGPLMRGGGTTSTHALLGGSPALDVGRGSAPFDQRGQPRAFDILSVPPPGAGDDNSDIGAVEMQARFVTTFNDAGAGSLREAIVSANGLDSLDDILFVGSGFNSPGIIQLASALPDIATPLTINGPGAKLLTVRRKGPAQFRIFNALQTATTVSMSGLTLANGDVSGDGGGIAAAGDLSLSEVAVIGNRADRGGGIRFAGGGGVINRSAVVANTASINGGGISFFSDDGDLLTIASSTLSGNMAPGATIGGALEFQASTVAGAVEIQGTTLANNSADRGGGIYVRGFSGAVATIGLRNCIVANNSAANDPNLSVNDTGTLRSDGYNLSNDTAGGFFSHPRDLTNAQAMLGPIADNGGPTQTLALLTGSAAIDKGHRSGTTGDQRNAARPVDDAGIVNATGGDGSDIGAFERAVNLLFANGFEPP